ncbi:MAG: 50S ribosomal protein L24 [Thermodesulfobacteriota bacterium]
MMSDRFCLKKNDLVMVIAGKERGKSGRILRVFPGKNRVLIEKVNFIKRHTRPSGQTRQGGIVEKEAPIHVSNVMVICGKCNVPIRVGRKVLEDGKKVRMCKKCGELLDK